MPAEFHHAHCEHHNRSESHAPSGHHAHHPPSGRVGVSAPGRVSQPNASSVATIKPPSPGLKPDPPKGRVFNASVMFGSGMIYRAILSSTSLTLILCLLSIAPCLSQELQTCRPEELDEIKNIVNSEELILTLTPRLKALNRAALNLKIPSGDASDLFSPDAKCDSIDLSADTKPDSSDLLLVQWKIENTHSHIADGIFEGFLRGVHHFHSAKFYFIDASLQDSNSKLNSTLGFKGTAELSNGELCSATARMSVTWEIGPTPKQSKITDWVTQSFKTISTTKKKMFREVLPTGIADQTLASELARSKHEEITLSLIRGDSVKRPADDQYPFFFPEVTLEHPSVSVVDLDRDGFDDFFLCRQHLPSLMLRNMGNGKFEEVGTAIGLRLPYDCTCSLFADYDNDGDYDVFVGRARHRAVYFENNDGKFLDQSKKVYAGKLPFLTSSIASADYNNDGLLDVYFSTYSPIEGSHGIVTEGVTQVWPSQFLSPNEMAEFRKRNENSAPFIDVPGPPNLLLENQGKSFVVAKCNSDLESWRKTFQSMWLDYDGDGDSDLYVCNDFAPDDFYRNEDGKKFTRVNDELGLTKLGFGMGVASQDHDRDGDLDLYVSNMFSKAGTRITRQVSQINPLLTQMASGNYLYNFDGRFKLASGKDNDQPAIAVTGWSWGGRFVDANNSGVHEIFVANGYYSAPSEVAEQTDL